MTETSIYCGVDIGASSTKLVLIDGDGQTQARAIQRSGVDYGATAEACLNDAAKTAGVDENQVEHTVATGYGRRNVTFADSVRTELSCHATGCYEHYGRAITIVDIGCQDNKIIRLDDTGQRTDFKMNRKCAAGTGAFLEEIALRLDLRLDDLEKLASGTTEAVQLNSFCTVFASTEILSHLRQGAQLEQLVRGAFASVINRVAEMDRLVGEVVLTGGVVAHNPTTAEVFTAKLGRQVLVPPHPQFTGALGAALIARTKTSEQEKDDA
ncbi:MAG: ATPase [bacterium]|nr:ATPase [bacterium]